MRYRTLGNSTLSVSEVGFGCWGIGGDSYGKTDDQVSIRAVHTALEEGINFFDTSDLYGTGRSEEVLGIALEDRREKAVIATKFGAIGGLEKQDFSPRYQRKALEASLKRLRTDYVNLYQLHSPKIDLLPQLPEIMEELVQLRTEGKIRAIGISPRSPQDAVRFITELPFDSVQINLNLLDQRAIECNLLNLAKDRGVGIIARTPLCFGFLTGKYADFVFPESDHRRTWSEAQRKVWAEGLYRFFGEKLKKMQETPVQFALNFCLSLPGVSTVIPGILTPEHARENATASGLAPMSSTELDRFLEVYRSTSFFVRT